MGVHEVTKEEIQQLTEEVTSKWLDLPVLERNKIWLPTLIKKSLEAAETTN